MTDERVRYDRVEERHRYEMFLDGELAGFAEYRIPRPGRIVFIHTVVLPGQRLTVDAHGNMILQVAP